MRWFAGWYISAVREDAPSVPVNARPVDASGRLWTVGAWDGWEVRTASTGTGVSATVFGSCFAGDAELLAALKVGRLQGDYREVSYLPGSFTTVVAEADRTVIVPDVAGQHAVFYTRWAGGYMFASSALALASLTDATPSVDWLAPRLLCPTVPETTAQDSVFDGIFRTPPGHLLVLDNQVARPVRLPVQMGGVQLSEGADLLREQLRVSVRARTELVCSLTSDLSGGLDSSTLALLAVEYARDPVLAITHFDSSGVSEDDRTYAAMCATAVGERLRHEVVMSGDEGLPFADLEHAPLSDEPGQEALLFARTREMLARPREAGSRIHLTGDGGDAVLAGGLTYLADLARAARGRELVREATAWARLRNGPALPVLRAAIVTGLVRYPAAIRKLAKQLRIGDTAAATPGPQLSVVWCTLSPAADWATATLRMDLADRLDETAHRVSDWQMGRFRGDDVALRTIHANAASARLDAELARTIGVNLHSPFFDNNVVRACLSVTVADRTTTRQAKPLLAAAMAGILPPALLGRRTKGNYTAGHYAGFQKAAGPLRALLDEPALAGLGLIEPAPVRAVLDRAISGLAAPIASLADVLAAELWLRRIAEQRRPMWEQPRRPCAPWEHAGRVDGKEIQHV